MGKTTKSSRRSILGVFAHPDDETSGAGGTFVRYAREGVDIYVATATRGEQGTLGAQGDIVTREELPGVREAEMRAVLKTYGVHPPMFLDYKDQEVNSADFDGLVGKVSSVMERTAPEVVITFGPHGISRHQDHIAVHRATIEAFRRYRRSMTPRPRLFYVAIPQDAARQYELDLDGPEVDPTVLVDITEFKPLKIQGLGMYKSQADAQLLAGVFQNAPPVEGFHQAWPKAPKGIVAAGFWE